MDDPHCATDIYDIGSQPVPTLGWSAAPGGGAQSTGVYQEGSR